MSYQASLCHLMSNERSKLSTKRYIGCLHSEHTCVLIESIHCYNNYSLSLSTFPNNWETPTNIWVPQKIYTSGFNSTLQPSIHRKLLLLLTMLLTWRGSMPLSTDYVRQVPKYIITINYNNYTTKVGSGLQRLLDARSQWGSWMPSKIWKHFLFVPENFWRPFLVFQIHVLKFLTTFFSHFPKIFTFSHQLSNFTKIHPFEAPSAASWTGNNIFLFFFVIYVHFLP